MTHVEKIENLTKYLMESEGYTETQAKFEAIRVLMEIQLNKRKECLTFSTKGAIISVQTQKKEKNYVNIRC